MININTFFIDTTVFDNAEVFKYYYQRMPQYRQMKIDRYIYDKDKKLSLGAGCLLQIALRNAGYKESEIIIGGNSKPYFLNVPGMHFSLSHSGSIAMCTVAGLEVGCDIEIMSEGYLDVAQSFLSIKEKDFINRQCDDKQKKDMFFRIWTLKESYLKANGGGFLYDVLNSFTILPKDDELVITLRGHNIVYNLLEINCGKTEYKAACCVISNNNILLKMQIDFINVL